MKTLCVATILLGYCTSLISAGFYHYNNHLVPTAPPPPPPQYLPNYDVLPPQEYEQPVNYHSWGGHGAAWKPITTFPWPGPEYEPHHPPHYHHGSVPPCPHKMKKFTTTTHKPTTTTTTTTTTHRPVETKKPHLLEKLGGTHQKHGH